MPTMGRRASSTSASVRPPLDGRSLVAVVSELRAAGSLVTGIDSGQGAETSQPLARLVPGLVAAEMFGTPSDHDVMLNDWSQDFACSATFSTTPSGLPGS